jgi:hypothetical protein
VDAPRWIVALSALGPLLLAGCGGGSSGTSPTGVEQRGSGAAGGGDSSGTAAADADAAKVDVCSLLSQEDASAVARAHGLNGAQTDATVYTLTATPQTDTSALGGTSSCKFHIDGEGAEGTVVVQVQSAKDFGLYTSGTKVAGVGDEAYKAQGSTVVRVGGLMMSAGEDSFTDDFVVDLYRKMAPHLK